MKIIKPKKKTILFVIFLLAFLISNYIIMNTDIGQLKLMEYGDGSGMLDFFVFFSGQEAATALNSLGAEGTAFYTRLLLIDFVFITSAAYVFAYLTEVLCNWSRLSQKWQQVKKLAYLRSVFDVLENILLLSSMYLFANNPTLLNFAGVITLLKWISMFVLVCFYLIFIVSGASKRLKGY